MSEEGRTERIRQGIRRSDHLARQLVDVWAELEGQYGCLESHFQELGMGDESREARLWKKRAGGFAQLASMMIQGKV